VSARSSVGTCALGCVAVFVLLVSATPAAGAASDGMLREQDVGMDEAKPAHDASLLRASQKAPGSCADPDTREYDGRLVSFGENSGPGLAEYVLDFASVSEAKSVFDDFKADDQAAVACGDTDFRTAGSLQKSPKGVGSRRYTFVTKATIGGKKVTTTSICAVQGQHLVLLVFVAWPKDSPTPATVAKKAVERLA
jgi:hypothetical protein